MFLKASFFSTILIFVTYLFYFVLNLLTPKTPVNLVPEETWWGDSDIKYKQDDLNVYPFGIKVSKNQIHDFYLRLNISRGFTRSLENTQQWFGLNDKVMSELMQYLRNKYDIKQRLKFMNQYPQFITQIHGLNIHFVHIKPQRVNQNVTVIPFLFLHGWPSSVLEFFEMIPRFTTPHLDQEFVFEMVIAALPGFGYSESARQKKFTMRHAANIFKILMNRLGHQKFYVHGSDWGGVTAAVLATMFPQHTIGFHSNFCFLLQPKSLARYLVSTLWPSLFVEEEFIGKIYPPNEYFWFLVSETGYFHLFSSKPDTIGCALDNSIEALLAYNFEKLSIGSNRKNIDSATAGLEIFNIENLLDITLFYYWFPKSSTTSARYYAENMGWHGLTTGLHEVPINKDVPCGCVFFEHEFVYAPPSFLKDKFANLLHFKTYKSAGHFGALERNSILAEDIWTFVKKVEKERQRN